MSRLGGTIENYTVIIVDDHQITRKGVRALIDDMAEFNCLGEAGDGLEAISLAKRLKPDLALIDLKMPTVSGAEVFVELRRWSPKTRVIILTGLAASAMFRSMVDNGLDGLFLKSCAPEELMSGIRRVAAGERVIQSDARAVLDQDPSPDLTRRELQVLQAIARGETNNIIADNLGISPKTVDSHRTNLMTKMKVHSVAELLTRALKDGFVSEGDHQ